MSEPLHLGDEVEILTDAFAADGAPRGSVGIIVDDWADGSNDVEVHDPKTGDVVARVRVPEQDARLYTGPKEVKEPRHHGIIFGRGDDLGQPVGLPDSADPLLNLYPNSRAVGPVGDIPPEGEISKEDEPWELQDAPQTGPIIL